MCCVCVCVCVCVCGNRRHRFQPLTFHPNKNSTQTTHGVGLTRFGILLPRATCSCVYADNYGLRAEVGLETPGLHS